MAEVGQLRSEKVAAETAMRNAAEKARQNMMQTQAAQAEAIRLVALAAENSQREALAMAEEAWRSRVVKAEERDRSAAEGSREASRRMAVAEEARRQLELQLHDLTSRFTDIQLRLEEASTGHQRAEVELARREAQHVQVR